ncbi:MAG: hypothetical protein V4670_00140 [Bacteroidota bacterium]
MKINNVSFSTLFAIGTFTIETLLFLFYQISKFETLLFVGFAFLLLAILFNGMILFHLVYELIISPEKEETAIKILIVLSNIPIAYLYFTLTLNNQ